MKELPDFRAVVKIGEKRWREVGAAWVKTEGKVAVRLQTMPIPKQGLATFLLVPNNGGGGNE